MNAKEKVSQLRKMLIDALAPLIDRDYYLLEVPYYTNIGDTLIWQGELDLLKCLPYKCKGMYSLETFRNTHQTIEEGALVLFQGGGNFGDLWTKHHDFKMSVMEEYPSCNFLFFPQTVWFQREENMLGCAAFMSKFSNVTICARDTTSFEILDKNFKNRILLLPDMAFCMDMSKWEKNYSASSPLLLKRKDSELKMTKALSDVEAIPGITISDWQTMQNGDDCITKLMLKLRDGRLKSLGLADLFVRMYYRSYLIKQGVKLLNTHTHIYTTRLHAAILGVLLGKDITFFDNSYGKNRSFYDSWLSDYDSIKFISNE